MKKRITLSVLALFAAFSFISSNIVCANGIPVVVSVPDYKIFPAKYDELSDPDIYFEIVYNGDVIETSETIHNNNFHSYGDIKPLGKYCQGISSLTPGDTVILKFYDSDYDTNIVKQFWEWIQSKLYKYIAYFGKQVELMNDSSKVYDDHDAYLAATNDPEMKRREDNLTNNVMQINNRRNNKHKLEYIGKAEIDTEKAVATFKSGAGVNATSNHIRSGSSQNNIGQVNVVVKRFDGFGASIKVKGY